MSARMREAATPIVTVLTYSRVAANPVITTMLAVLTATWTSSDKPCRRARDIPCLWPLKFIYKALFLGHKHWMSLALLQGLSLEVQVAVYTASMVVITGFAATLEYVSTVTMGVAASRILADIRGHLFRHLANLSVSFHGRNRTGDLITHVTYDVDRMREV